MDSNFWKDKYQPLWESATAKEALVTGLIENATGWRPQPYGLGAASTAYISGSAADNHHTKGDADLDIKEADVFIEVTGPNIKVSGTDALWIRPDKIQNALAKIARGEGKGHFVAHVIKQKQVAEVLIRVVPITEALLHFRTIHPTIRGTVETYKEVPANYAAILSFEAFIQTLIAATSA